QASAALRAAAEEWQLTFDAVDEPMVLLEGPGREITRINRAGLELAGERPASLSDLAHAQPWTTGAALADAVARSRSPALDHARDGKRVWLGSVAPLRAGQPILALRGRARLGALP